MKMSPAGVGWGDDIKFKMPNAKFQIIMLELDSSSLKVT